MSFGFWMYHRWYSTKHFDRVLTRKTSRLMLAIEIELLLGFVNCDIFILF